MINAISGVTPRFSAKGPKSRKSASQAEAERIAEKLFPRSNKGQRQVAVVVLTGSPGSASAVAQAAKK